MDKSLSLALQMFWLTWIQYTDNISDFVQRVIKINWEFNSYCINTVVFVAVSDGLDQKNNYLDHWLTVVWVQVHNLVLMFHLKKTTLLNISSESPLTGGFFT